MRNVVVEREFEHLRVNQHKPQALGRIPKEHRQNHGVDAHGLARTRRTRHQKMRRLSEINHHGVTGNVFAQGKRKR